jgi:hypothetical protein
VFRKLRQDQSFCFTAYAPVGPRSTPTTNLQCASLHTRKKVTRAAYRCVALGVVWWCVPSCDSMLTELPPHLQQADTLVPAISFQSVCTEWHVTSHQHVIPTDHTKPPAKRAGPQRDRQDRPVVHLGQGTRPRHRYVVFRGLWDVLLSLVYE